MAEILKLEVVTPERRAIQTDASEVQLPVAMATWAFYLGTHRF